MNGYATHNGPSQSSADQVSTQLDRWLLRRVLAAVGNPTIRIRLWDGYETVGESDSRNDVVICFHDRGALYHVLYKPSLTFGLLFTAGRVTVLGELTGALEAIYDGLDRMERRSSVLQRLVRRITDRSPRANTLQESKKNIHCHYDLGNDFYQLWLDREHDQYTCAYYPEPGVTLEQAQSEKLELICRKLWLQPGETVVEAGGGWGGLARYMARHYGVNVRSYNISSEQVAYAKTRARAEGLEAQIETIEDDYRNIQGAFDAFVSVGMVEHVGPRNFDTLGNTIDRCLKDEGRGLIHSIGQRRPRRMNEWIETCIFPGGEPPSLGQMMEIFEPHELAVVDVENLRPHYARTLTHWLERFEANAEAVETLFDADFVRAWRLYLSGSTVAFKTGGLQLFQVLFQRPQCRTLPETRAHLFTRQTEAARPRLIAQGR